MRTNLPTIIRTIYHDYLNLSRGSHLTVIHSIIASLIPSLGFQARMSESSYRKVFLPSDLMHELKVWRVKEKPNELNLVIPNQYGKPFHHNHIIQKWFKPLMKKIRKKPFRWHDLRHFNVSFRILSGQNIKFIQRQMGHADIKMTLKPYRHLFNSDVYNMGQVNLFEESLRSANR